MEVYKLRNGEKLGKTPFWDQSVGERAFSPSGTPIG